MRLPIAYWFLLLFTNLALWMLVSWVNQTLNTIHIHLYIPTAFVIFCARYASSRNAYIMAATMGLLLDASTPVPFGTHTILLLVATIAIRISRDALSSERYWHLAIFGGGINTIVLLLLAIVAARHGTLILSYGTITSLVVNLFVTLIVFILIVPWFIELQRSLLYFAGLRTAPEHINAK